MSNRYCCRTVPEEARAKQKKREKLRNIKILLYKMKMDNPAFSPQYKMLDRPFMSMDGNLLTVCFEKGSFIPDKLIEKEDVISSITEEIFTTLKNKNEVNLKFVCFFLPVMPSKNLSFQYEWLVNFYEFEVIPSLFI